MRLGILGRTLLNTCLFYGGIGIALYTTEALLTTWDAEAYYGKNGTYDGVRYTWGHQVFENSSGFREREFSREPDAGEFRIMVLGDSLTWGAGVAVSERYTDILQQSLRSALGRRVSVWNYARSGGDVITECTIARNEAPIIQPQILLLGFCINDTQPFGQTWSMERDAFLQRIAWLPEAQSALRSIGLPKTSTLIAEGVFAVAERAGAFPDGMTALQRTYDESSAAWLNFRRALDDIVELSRSVNAAPMLVVLSQSLFTGTAEDYHRTDFSEVRRMSDQAAEAGRLAGFDVIRVDDAIRDLDPNTSLIINPHDGHPSAALHQTYAQVIFERLLPAILAAKISED